MFPAILAALGRGAAALGRGAGSTAGKSTAGMDTKQLARHLAKNAGNGGDGETKSKGAGFADFTSKFLSAQGSFSKAFRTLTSDITAPIDGINALGQSINKFVSLSSPGKTALFDLRIKDAYAVVGRSMEPMLDIFTKVAENIGDMFARSGPQLKRMFTTIGKFFETFGAITVKMEPVFNAVIMLVDKLVGTFNRLIGPLDSQNTFWDKLADTMARFIDNIGGFVDFLATVFDQMWDVFKKFGDRIGGWGKVALGAIPGGVGLAANWAAKKAAGGNKWTGPDSSSMSKPSAKAAGTAVRQAEIVNSADELQRKMAVQALTAQGMGEQKTEGVQIKIALETIHEDMMDLIRVTKEKGANLTDKLQQFLSKNAAEAALLAGVGAGQNQQNPLPNFTGNLSAAWGQKSQGMNSGAFSADDVFTRNSPSSASTSNDVNEIVNMIKNWSPQIGEQVKAAYESAAEKQTRTVLDFLGNLRVS